MAILIVSTSLNPQSRSRAMAWAAVAAFDRLDAETVFVDLQQTRLPWCDGGASSAEPAAQLVRRQVADADAVVLATPVYNYNVSGSAKNLIELTGDAWQDKIVAFLCAAGGQHSYMSVMGLANSLMLDYRCVIVPRFVYASDAAFKGAELINPAVLERIDALAADTLRFARALNPLAHPTEM